jgi:DNA polymerase-3 subunit beta
MKFSVNTFEFKKALSKVEKGLRKSVLPVLENIKLEVTDGICSLYSTDLNQFIVTNIDAFHCSGSCKFIFSDTKTAFKAMKFFTDDIIDFNFENDIVNLKCGNKKAALKILDDDYPEFPDVKENCEKYLYTAEKLSERYNLIKYAVSVDNKPILTGVHFNQNEIVSCDGYRLSVNSDNNLQIETPFTVPNNALKLCSDVLEGSISITANKKHIIIEDKNTKVVSRLLDGEYINYKQFIPNNENMITVDINSFIENLRYLKTFTNKKDQDIAWKNDRLCYKNLEGIFESEIKIKGNFDYTIGFNVDFMYETLTQFKDGAEFYMPDNNYKPMVLRRENNFAFILPVKLKRNPFEKSEDVA